MNALGYFAMIALLIVLIGVINERFFHMQSDIALLVFSVCLSGGIILLGQIPQLGAFIEWIKAGNQFDFATYLLDGVLCFMLFAGASKVSITKFKNNFRLIGLLALLGTVISSLFYGVLFFLVASLLKLEMDFFTCVLLGCIVSPTDPIAATGILSKLGMNKNVTAVIECESLFNDGTGVALFLFVKGLVARTSGENFFVIMGKEIIGAMAVSVVVSVLLFQLLKCTKDSTKHILISLTAVMLVYVICEHLGFSGVIASVLCGMLFAYMRSKIERRLAVQDDEERYHSFWEVADSILNAVLFVMLGTSILNAQVSSLWPILVPCSIIIVILSRFTGVFTATMFMEKNTLPGNYSKLEFSSLMTWAALKGGLSLALALGTKEIVPESVYLIILNVTYITIFFTVIVQGLTTKKGYAWIEKKKTNRIIAERNAR